MSDLQRPELRDGLWVLLICKKYLKSWLRGGCLFCWLLAGLLCMSVRNPCFSNYTEFLSLCHEDPS